MSNFDKLKKQLDKAEENASIKREEFYGLITEVLSVFNLNNDHYDDVWSNETHVIVNYSWRAAGCNCSDSITLPKSIFDAADPVAVAKIYKNDLDNSKKKSERSIKLEEFNALKKELGVKIMKATHPIQPLVSDKVGTTRFKENAIVSYLIDIATQKGIADMNSLAIMNFSNEDREQFAQLIGYSLDGFGELSYVSDETYDLAAKQKVFKE